MAGHVYQINLQDTEDYRIPFSGVCQNIGSSAIGETLEMDTPESHLTWITSPTLVILPTSTEGQEKNQLKVFYIFLNKIGPTPLPRKPSETFSHFTAFSYFAAPRQNRTIRKN